MALACLGNIANALDPRWQERPAATLPLTLGSDLSGIVEALGSKVTAFEPGDLVFGVTRSC
jgi:NADPH:quinone reductase-like Zn-dependent oxidoreductase